MSVAGNGCSRDYIRGASIGATLHRKTTTKNFEAPSGSCTLTLLTFTHACHVFLTCLAAANVLRAAGLSTSACADLADGGYFVPCSPNLKYVH